MKTWPEEALVRAIIKRIRVDRQTGCWVWTRGTWRGYAMASLDTITGGSLVHRWVYEHYIDSIPKGYHVHHVCGNKACINPEHLIAVTPAEHKRLHRT